MSCRHRARPAAPARSLRRRAVHTAAGLAAVLLQAKAAAATADTLAAHRWIVAAGDHRGRPFAIVDKRAARIAVYDAQGAEVAETPVLLGRTVGDEGTPGVGLRAQQGQVGPDERTTPAGRFEAEPGRNLDGEPIVWLDYEAALAIHRLRPGLSQRPRQQRMASERPQDRRVSQGCVVVPVAFYESVVAKLLGRGRSVVYVLPEQRPLDSLIPTALAAAR